MCACTERLTPSFSEGIIDRTGAQTMLYLTCTMISSVDLAHYGVSLAKYWVSMDCGTNSYILHLKIVSLIRFMVSEIDTLTKFR